MYQGPAESPAEKRDKLIEYLGEHQFKHTFLAKKKQEKRQ